MAGEGNISGGVPIAIGAPPPRVYLHGNKKPENPTEYFEAILNVLQHLDARLAPPKNIQQVKFASVPVGESLNIRLTSEYNAFLNCLTQGTVDLFFSPPGGSPPYTAATLPALDIQFNPPGNPMYTTIGARNEQQLGFVVDPSSGTPAQGSIFILNY